MRSIYIECEPHVQYELRDAFLWSTWRQVPSFLSWNRHWMGDPLFPPKSRSMLVCWSRNCASELNYTWVPRQQVLRIAIRGKWRSFARRYRYQIVYTSYKPRDYQLHAYTLPTQNRKLIISPTASGKSLMICSVALCSKRRKHPNRSSYHISRWADV